MLTRFSKWLLYATSYSILLFLIDFRIVFNEENAIEGLKENLRPIIVMIVIGILLVLWTRYFLKWNMNERINVRVTDNITLEMLALLFPYVVTMATITIDFYGVIINVMMFILLGIAFVASDKVYFSLIFIAHGYKLYKTTNGTVILCKLSKEQINIKMMESEDGLECREIGRKIFWIKENVF